MHVKLLSPLFCFLFCSLQSFAGDGSYAVLLIKPELRKNAHAVMRYDDISVEIRSVNDMVVKKKWVVTVFDAEGDSHAELSEYYDNNFFKAPSIDGNLYDGWGKKIKSVKKSDINDVSAVSSISLMEDSRMKMHSFEYKNYPYTVEYEIEQHQTQTMFLENWNPLTYYNIGVEQSSFNVVVPENYELRYKLINQAGTPAISSAPKKKIFHWEIHNQIPIEKVYASPGWARIAPAVYIGPSEFAMNDFKGDMSSWNAYGKSMYQLVSNRTQLPPQIKSKVHELTDGIQSPEQKAIRVYEYLQGITRYISVQLGIGGWQPFDATYVATNGYGDCKALSNFMLSLLKEAGVKSYYTLVLAGSEQEDILPDFPMAHFNHVIVCVPFQTDSLWFECTSQTESAGYMGSFTGNRHVLLVTEEGGKLVCTPTYKAAINTQVRSVKAELTEAGDLNVRAVSKYQAVSQDKIYLHYWSEEEKMKKLQSKFDIGTYEITKFQYEEQKSKLPVIKESIDLVAKNYASITGKRIFISPNILSKTQLKLAAEDDRKYDLRMPWGASEIDTVEISLPDGYEPEYIPEETQLKTKFASFSAKVKVEGRKLYFYRSYLREGGTFPGSEYADFVKFFNEVYKNDRNKVVLVKKAG